MAVINLNLFSMMLRFGTDVTVVLPDEIQKDEKLACVWLYHGGSGDHTDWLYHTDLVDEVEKRHFAAVLPNVNESCFVNMNIGGKYESYVAKELPSIIWNMFKCISDKREDNYVSGYSGERDKYRGRKGTTALGGWYKCLYDQKIRCGEPL